ncbi:MAG: YbaK/EbsC family protein [Chloroflexi bacterium]|nr:YbaK/EbsC family protein [Chloroflexota bacterium]
MSLQRATQHLARHGLENRIRIFPTSSATVELAAQAVGCPPERIAKTLSFKLEGRALLVVAAGDARIDNAKFKAHFHGKAVMLAPHEVEPLTGHAVGGVCPFGVNDGVEVYLDESLRRFETVYPACGSDNSAVEVTLEELARSSGSAAWVDVCKGWQ